MINTKKITIPLTLFLLTIFCKTCICNCQGTLYKNTVTVTGKLITIGNEPFLQTILVDENGNRFIINDKKNILNQSYYGTTVQVSGKQSIIVERLVNSSKDISIQHLIPQKIKVYY